MTGTAPPPSPTLVELAVTDLGIIEHLRLVFGPGMTALTGETGAGKTLLVGAIELLLGGRAEPSMVRTGAAEAVVEGRFVVDDQDLVLTRVIPVEGRSRAYVDGRIDRLSVNFVGAEVKAGEPLASLYSPMLLAAERERPKDGSVSRDGKRPDASTRAKARAFSTFAIAMTKS